jgi:Kef-type K+ transport system membrane component KefB
VEILAGIAIGPALLLFLAGLELDVRLLGGRRLHVTVGAFAASMLVALKDARGSAFHPEAL